jgi:hypothetical protein
MRPHPRRASASRREWQRGRKGPGEDSGSPGARLTAAVVEAELSPGRRLRPDSGEAKIFFLFYAKWLYKTFFDFTKMFVF